MPGLVICIGNNRNLPLTDRIYGCHARAGHIVNLDVSLCKLAKILELLFVKD